MLMPTSFLWPFGPVTLKGQAVFVNTY